MKARKITGLLLATVLLLVLRSHTAELLYQTAGGVELYQGQSCAVLGDNAFLVEGRYQHKVRSVLGTVNIPVNVKKSTHVVPGGQCIGIALYTDGVMVVGSQEIKGKNKARVNPAADAGIKPGDIIKKVNGTKIKSIAEFVLLAEKNMDKEQVLAIQRGHQTFTTVIKAAYDADDDKYRLGMWLKDSTAGIGTLTYYNSESKSFGALGHAVCESQTGVKMPLDRGEIVKCVINDIKKGQKGIPGELRGSFRADAETLGIIGANTDFGLYGVMEKEMKGICGQTPIGSADSVKTGKATILTTLDESIKEYDIQIVKINSRDIRSQKGMVIQITDQELLSKTGGIVQGMSGSPVIQNGKLVGAVTHVLVNDPTRGYAIFIENMLETANQVAEEQAKKDAS